MKTLVSVILPTFNMGMYISRAIDSILSQTLEDFELIVLNDGSTDQTADILAAYAQQDQRIVVVHNPKNIGLIRTLNKGLEIAQGTLVARQDADNYSTPTRLAEQVSYLEQHPHIGLVGTRVFVIDDHKQTISNNIYPCFVLPSTLIPWELLFYPYFSHDTIVARRDLLLQVGGYRLDRIHAEDYDLWYRLSRVTQLAILPNIRGYLYRNPEGVSQKFADAQNQTCKQIIRDAMSELLSKSISLTDAHIMFKIARTAILSTADEMHRCEVLLSQLHTAYLSKFALIEKEKAFLEANLTNKLYMAKMLFHATQLSL
ncbi:MAG: glycosyltransferase family 2 protein [Nostoc sp.]|uniref:glycosyltransferase family 2 protein n=1 Tax=Nostoc sp. TaxID=1180 RepID=UPI002FF8BE71